MACYPLKRFILRVFLCLSLSVGLLVAGVQPDFASYPTYGADDLGLNYSPAASQFKLWSPPAKRVWLHLYAEGLGGAPLESLPLEAAADGIWTLTIRRDLAGLFYTFQIESDQGRLDETPGIYAKAVGVNGLRAAIIDLDRTDPEGWEQDVRPPLATPQDIILYEVQVRDFTIAPNAGSSHPGKYLGMVEAGTKNAAGQATGIDHLRELGITHVHLLPVFDHQSIDETKLDLPQYNWGYDPQNYNVPEGSFATDPYAPASRINEFKRMVQGFHRAGLRVIMDVVYNHTGRTENSNFNLEVPGYYYRQTADGGWSNASACGNETASDRAMMRKYMIDSCKYWVREYRVDGFRFDLMGIHDLATMNALAAELLQIEPTLFFYGEGWTAGTTPLPVSQQAIKANTTALRQVAAFSDDLRDGLKGSVFEPTGKGFVNGGEGTEPSVKFGIVAATLHPQVNYAQVNYSKAPWAPGPAQCINYVSCHDNQTLYDKLLTTSGATASAREIEQMDKLANAIVLTSQGVPFLHAGEEMLRTKGGEENSYNLPDSVNRIDWERKTAHANVVNYYAGLMALRKSHPAFRLPTAESIRKNLHFLESLPPHVIAYRLDGKAVGDAWSEILVIFNANRSDARLDVPPGLWRVAVTGDGVDLGSLRTIEGGRLDLPALSAWVLWR